MHTWVFIAILISISIHHGLGPEICCWYIAFLGMDMLRSVFIDLEDDILWLGLFLDSDNIIKALGALATIALGVVLLEVYFW